MATKNFKKNASEYFISSEAGTDPKPEPRNRTPRTSRLKKEDLEGLNLPRGYKVVKEARSERIQLLVRPSTKELLQADANKAGKSLNEFVNDLIEDYLGKGGK